MKAIASTESHTFIYLNSGGAYVIPRRSIPEEEYQAFVDAVRRGWEQAGTLAWLPAPAPEKSPRLATAVGDTDAVARAQHGVYRSSPRQKMRRCPSCGKPTYQGKLTCQQCGRTWWAPIALRFAFAVALKAGAVCAGLWLQNPWANGFAAWGGSILAGYIFLAVVANVLDAFRTHKARSRLAPELANGPAMKAYAFTLGDSLLCLTVVVAFVLVGNRFGAEVGAFLAIGFVPLILVMLAGMLWAALLSSREGKLAARMVARPGEWPAVTPVNDGIVAGEAGTAPARPAPGVVTASPGGQVELRVLGTGSRLAAGTSVAITLDGQLIGVGSLRRGFDARGATAPGVHKLQVRWGLVTQRFAVYLPQAGAYEAALRYSGFWGRFSPQDGQD